MARRTLSDRVDELSQSLSILVERVVAIREELASHGDELAATNEDIQELERRLIQQIHQIDREILAQVRNQERELALLQRDVAGIRQELAEHRANLAKAGERRHAFQHDLFLALVNAFLAALIAYFVARS